MTNTVYVNLFTNEAWWIDEDLSRQLTLEEREKYISYIKNLKIKDADNGLR